jgi:hypothetical protein
MTGISKDVRTDKSVGVTGLWSLALIVMAAFVLAVTGFIPLGGLNISQAQALDNVIDKALHGPLFLPGVAAKPSPAKPKPAKGSTTASEVTLPSGGDGTLYGWTQLDPSWHDHLPASASPYITLIDSIAKQYNLDPRVAAADMWWESNAFQPRICSNKGACGLAQLMPKTAAGMGITDRMDPKQAIGANIRLLRSYITKYGSLRIALAAYDAGSGNVAKYHGVPPIAETLAYIPAVESLYKRLGGTVLKGG